MEGERLPRDEAEIVVDRFADAPVTNPGNASGIDLHVVFSETVPAESTTETGSENDDLDRYEENYGDHTGAGYHYLLVARNVVREGGDDVAGVGGVGRIAIEEINRTNATGSIAMHELAHSLGLVPTVHDGIDSHQYSYSEYPSVLNDNAAGDTYAYSSGGASSNDCDDWGYIDRYMYTPDLVSFREYYDDNPFLSG